MKPRPLRRLRAILLASLALAACGDGAPPRGLLLVTVDTLRADHVGSYGYPGDTSPALDALAERGVRFADATVQWPATWPSMASMLTGNHPRTTGVRRWQRLFHPSNVTLAEVLRDAGFRTGAVVANLSLAGRFGFDQGFERFVESWAAPGARAGGGGPQGPPGTVKRFTDARIVTDQGLRWLAGLAPDERFFLWLHYMDPHGPYEPPAGFAERFAETTPTREVAWFEIPEYQRRRDPETGEPETDLARYVARYDGEIRFFDDQLGRLLAGLEAGGRADSTLVVVTADHGESLDEHGAYLQHGRMAYQTTARVPWILAHEASVPAGRVVDAPVGLVSLVPTVLELLGVPSPAGFEGRSLVPLFDGAGEPPPNVFFEAGDYRPSQLAVREGPWKLVHLRNADDRKEQRAPEFRLFHLGDDPGELRDVRAAHPEVAARLGRALADWLEATPLFGPPGAAPPLDDATREALEALGYAEPAPAP